jgi:hypothetical protein
MTDLNAFFSSIRGAETLNAPELIDLFVHYLTVENGAPAATVTQIGECFKIFFARRMRRIVAIEPVKR